MFHDLLFIFICFITLKTMLCFVMFVSVCLFIVSLFPLTQDYVYVFQQFFFLIFFLSYACVFFFLYVWFFSLCFICSGLCTLSLALRTPIILARRTQVTRCLSLLLVLRPLDFVVPGSFSRNSQSRKISDYFVFLFCNTR